MEIWELSQNYLISTEECRQNNFGESTDKEFHIVCKYNSKINEYQDRTINRLELINFMEKQMENMKK